jgi:sn-glycerol 3-phosphate transport system permease protein
MRMKYLYGIIIKNFLRIFMVIIVLFPLWFAVSSSFMHLSELLQRPPKIFPSSFSLQYYRAALRVAPLIRYLQNSFIMSSGIMLGQLILGSFAAFAFAFFNFRGKRFLFVAILATMMIPGESIIISNYMTVGDLRWFDTFQALILPGTASAISVFFMRQAFLSTPRELYEVSKIDGCTNFRFFLQILMPLSKAQLGALGIYAYLGSWNQYLWPLLVTNRNQMRTVQVGISMLKNSEFMETNLVMAGVTIILLPSILIFFIGQKQILSGAFSGSLKG